MPHKKMTSENWDAILLRRAYGMTESAIVKELNVSKSVVYNTLRAFDAVKNRDWETCIDFIVNWRLSLELFKWAAKKTGAELPENVFVAYSSRLAADDRKRTAKKSVPVASETDTVSAENERIFTLKMLELLAKTNELLEQLMDVVMPKHCGDLKDNVNANCDIICERLKNCEDKLEGIKANTRKRGL